MNFIAMLVIFATNWKKCSCPKIKYLNYSTFIFEIWFIPFTIWILQFINFHMIKDILGSLLFLKSFKQ